MIIDLKHYFLTSSTEVNAIVKPLKDFFGITSFVYQKNFLDGSEIRLTNQPHWVLFFFEKELYKTSVFEHTPTQYQRGWVLWGNLAQHKTVLGKAREFNIDHGITFIDPQADGCEFFFLGTTREHPEIVSRYLNHLDLLEKFLAYFKEKAAPLIKQAISNKIIIPEKFIHTPTRLQQAKLDREAFLNVISGNYLQKFTPREAECIKLLLRGYNFKMIAYELKLSYRTVETHFDHIKQKTNCYTKAELVKYLSRALPIY
jgi:DNA-binding CsgD family transcriptional regulator